MIRQSLIQILAVCTGNVCRSPLAQLVLARTLDPDVFAISSAGTRPVIDARMMPEAAPFALERGVPQAAIQEHRARWLDETHLTSPELILAMAREHRTAVVELAPTRLRSTFTVREFARLATQLTDADATSVADASGQSPSERLAALLAHLSGIRSDIGPPDRAEDDDVLDPYLGPPPAYARMANELLPALDQVSRILAIVARC